MEVPSTAPVQLTSGLAVELAKKLWAPNKVIDGCSFAAQPKDFVSSETICFQPTSAPLVFVRSENQCVFLHAQTSASDAPVRFTVARNQEDTKGAMVLGTPKLAVEGATARLSLNACGSFYVAASVDKQPPTEPIRCVAIVIVNPTVTALKAQSALKAMSWHFKGYDGKLYADKCADVSVLRCRAAGMDEKASAASLEANVGLLGGGKDGALGIDRVAAGWLSNLTDSQRDAEYSSKLHIRRRYACTKDLLSGGSDMGLMLDDVKAQSLVPVGFPLLDTSRSSRGKDWTERNALASSGGESVLLSKSSCQPQKSVLTVRADDTPSEAFAVTDEGESVLTSATWGMQLRNALLLWTLNAPQLYSALAVCDWGFEAHTMIALEYHAEGDGSWRGQLVEPQVKCSELTMKPLDVPKSPESLKLQVRPPTVQAATVMVRGK